MHPQLSSVFRRSFRTLAATAVLAAAMVSSPLQAAVTQIKLGTVVWIGYGPFYVAESLDLFKKYNLNVKLQVFNDPALIPSAVSGGAVEGGMLTYDQVIGAVAQGEQQVVVMPIDYSSGGDAIVATSDIRSVKDFKGKKVAFNQLSPSDFLLSYALKVNGMNDTSVQPVNMTPEAIPAAMASGSVPVGVTYEPNISQILAQGKGKKFHVVFSSKNAPGLITDVLVFPRKYIKAHPDVVKGVMQAYLDGLAYMQKNPDAANKIIGKVLGVTPAEVKEQMAGVHNLSQAEMPVVFAKKQDTMSFYTSGALIGDILKAKGQIKRVPATEETFDDQFVKAMTAK